MNVRHIGRSLARQPGFTLAAVAALALGIGANTAIYSVVHAVLLRPLPYHHPERIVLLMRDYRRFNTPALNVSQFVYARENTRSFEALSAHDVLGAGYNLTGAGEPERVRGVRAAAAYFEVFGAQPALGRAYTAEEDRPDGPLVAVISDGLWKRRFGGDHAIAGKTITLNARPYTVLGVMPPGFESQPAAEVWIPLRAVINPRETAHLYLTLGRLKPGVTLAQARADLDRVARDFRKLYPNLLSERATLGAQSYHQSLVGDVRLPLLILLGAAGFVLLIACANVANLLLARAVGRTREMAVRAALGAGRWRIVRQLLAESSVLAVLGGGLGLLLAAWAVPALLALSPGNLPRLSEISVNLPVLWFTLAASLLTGIVFGLAPAFQAARLDLHSALKEGTSRTIGSIGGGRMRGALVVAETGLSLVLLIGAALLLRTFANLRGVTPGFDPNQALTFETSLGDRYDSTAKVDQFIRRVVQRLESLPGVETAAMVSNLPTEMGPDLPLEIEGRPDLPADSTQYRPVSSHFFQALRIPVRGRTFTENDTQSSLPVIIVNEAFVRAYLRGRDPFGERVTIGREMGPDFTQPPRVIVGVAGDVQEDGLERRPPPVMYIPMAQSPDLLTRLGLRVAPIAWVVRAGPGHSSGLARNVQREVLGVDPLQPTANLRPLSQVLAASIARQQFNMLLLAVFAGLAVLLASLGIYGVMSYSVNRRQQELGIRMAMGARAGQLVRMVVRQGMRLALAGIALGLAAAAALSRVLRDFLYGVQPTDTLTFVAVAALLGCIALLACWIPARRATRVDPLEALRYE